MPRAPKPKAPAPAPIRDKAAPPSFAYIQSLERGLAIITSFNEHHPQQTLADVARATDLDRATARRFLLTLQALGYIEQDGRHFRLAPRTLQLGYGYLASLPWWRTAQNISERLTAKVGASSAVGVLDQHNIVYVAYASAGRFPQLMSRSVGTHLPAVATAIGRVLLALLTPQDMRRRIAAAPLEQFTPLTTTSPATLENVLQKIRQNGYALVDQELEIGLRSIGVPIRNRGGEVVAGLSVSVLEGQMTPDQVIERYLGALRQSAQEITDSLAA